MSSISKCPKCKQEVTVPVGLRREAEVRCPLCNAKYPVSDALAELPPELIPVDPADPQAVKEATTTAAETPRIDTGETPVDASALAAFSSGNPPPTQQEAASGEAVSAGVASAKPRPKRKEKGMGRLTIEALLGGFAGLLIGYYLLCWIGGDRLDLPKLNLPFLPHTMNRDADNNVGGDTDNDMEGNEAEGGKAETANRDDEQPSRSKQPPRSDGADPKQKPEVDPPDTDQIQPLDDDPPVELGDSMPADYVGPRDVPRFASIDLGQALRAADLALKSAKADGNVTDEVYDLLCKVGYVDVFVKNEANDPQHVHRQQAARNMLRKLGQDAKQLTQIWDLAVARLKTKGGPQGGILIAGKVGKISTQGDLHVAVIKPATYSASLVVLSNKPLPLKTDDEVLLLGTVIKDPAKNIIGYTGTMPMVIWAGTSVEVKQ